MQCWQNLGFTPPDQLASLAVAAEEVGFTGVTLPEHLATPELVETPNPYVAGGGAGYEPDTPFPDPWIVFGSLGMVTERLRFMANVFVLPLRPLLVAARSIATAAVLTGDRVTLGVGVGWLREEFEAAGADFTTRGTRTDEALDLLPRLLSGEAVGADLAEHRFAPVRIVPAPSQPVPVIVGGVSPAALRRAAIHDGWVGINYAVDDLLPILDRLAAARESAGTADRPFTVMVSRPPDFDAAIARRLADAGVTAIVNRPTRFQVEAGADLAAHQAAMAEFVDLVRS